MRRCLLAIALALALGACTLPGARPPWRPPPSLPSAETLRQILAERREAVWSLRAESHIAVSGARSGSARQVLLVERPDRLRMEVFSLFGTAFVLVAADGTLAAYVRAENRLYRGPATPANLARYTGVDLSLPDVVELLLGNAPPRVAGHGSVFFDPATGTIRLRQQTARGAQVVAFGGDPLAPVAVEEWSADAVLLWGARFADHRPAEGAAVPRKIHFDLPRRDERVDIELMAPEVNPSLPPTVFALQTPLGSEEVRLDPAGY